MFVRLVRNIARLASEEAQKELGATVAARCELGPEHEEHLISGFLERMDREIDRRVEERVAKRRRHGPALGPQHLRPVPVVLFAGIFGEVVWIVAALIALAVVFVVLSGSRR